MVLLYFKTESKDQNLLMAHCPKFKPHGGIKASGHLISLPWACPVVLPSWNSLEAAGKKTEGGFLLTLVIILIPLFCDI